MRLVVDKVALEQARPGFSPSTFVFPCQYHYSNKTVVSYGAEAWALTKKEQAVLNFERKIVRRIYGPGYENGEWKSRTNRELEEMSKGENIVKWIKV